MDRRWRKRKDQGGILVLAVIVIPVVLIVTGLGIDSFILFTKKLQQQTTAEQAALGALAEFIDSGSSARAIEVAEKIGGLAKYVMSSGSPVTPGELASGAAGTVSFGVWDGEEFRSRSNLAEATAVQVVLKDTNRTKNLTQFGNLVGMASFAPRESAAVASFDSRGFEEGTTPYSLVFSR